MAFVSGGYLFELNLLPKKSLQRRFDVISMVMNTMMIVMVVGMIVTMRHIVYLSSKLR